MDSAISTQSWLERAITKVHASEYYQQHVMDEWYETLPVPIHNGNEVFLLISYGKNVKTLNPQQPLKPDPPHLNCYIRYPDGFLRWNFDVKKNIWPNWGLAPATPMGQAKGKAMERRRTYFSAMSHAMDLGAFSMSVATPEACAAVTTARDALLAAANPTLGEYYGRAVTIFDNWLQAHCLIRE